MNLFDKKGFTLLEVLVSMVIIAIGLLAVADMQTVAITGNVSANNLTIATQLAEEMVDRIRVNAGDTPGTYNGIDTKNTCAGANPALGDCQQWKNRLEGSGLPGASGQVTVSASDSPIGNTRTITVTVTWGAVTTRTVRFTTIMETWLT